MADIRRNMLMVNTTQHTNVTRAQRGSDWEGRGKRETERAAGTGRGKDARARRYHVNGQDASRADDVTASLRHGTSGGGRPRAGKGERERDGPRYDGEESADGFRLALVGQRRLYTGYVIDGRRDAVDRSFSPSKKGPARRLDGPGLGAKVPQGSCFNGRVAQGHHLESSRNDRASGRTLLKCFFQIRYTRCAFFVILRVSEIKRHLFMCVCFYLIMNIRFDLKYTRLRFEIFFMMKYNLKNLYACLENICETIYNLKMNDA